MAGRKTTLPESGRRHGRVALWRVLRVLCGLRRGFVLCFGEAPRLRHVARNGSRCLDVHTFSTTLFRRRPERAQVLVSCWIIRNCVYRLIYRQKRHQYRRRAHPGDADLLRDAGVGQHVGRGLPLPLQRGAVLPRALSQKADAGQVPEGGRPRRRAHGARLRRDALRRRAGFWIKRAAERAEQLRRGLARRDGRAAGHGRRDPERLPAHVRGTQGGARRLLQAPGPGPAGDARRAARGDRVRRGDVVRGRHRAHHRVVGVDARRRGGVRRARALRGAVECSREEAPALGRFDRGWGDGALRRRHVPHAEDPRLICLGAARKTKS
mmetsp:Transcript_7850/g.20913  ORF Transcript_7850/g.20913 Transcript_7850/m.20913 type:complete len:324 (-) Transcript_7850:9-980(-)